MVKSFTLYNAILRTNIFWVELGVLNTGFDEEELLDVLDTIFDGEIVLFVFFEGFLSVLEPEFDTPDS
jgi:hypothetical protein